MRSICRKKADETTITLSDKQIEDAWKVAIDGDEYVVTGQKIEKFALRTDFENIHSVNRLRDIMKKMGIMHELVRQNARPDSMIRFGTTGVARLTMQEIAEN